MFIEQAHVNRFVRDSASVVHSWKLQNNGTLYYSFIICETSNYASLSNIQTSLSILNGQTCMSGTCEVHIYFGLHLIGFLSDSYSYNTNIQLYGLIYEAIVLMFLFTKVFYNLYNRSNYITSSQSSEMR